MKMLWLLAAALALSAPAVGAVQVVDSAEKEAALLTTGKLWWLADGLENEKPIGFSNQDKRRLEMEASIVSDLEQLGHEVIYLQKSELREKHDRFLGRSVPVYFVRGWGLVAIEPTDENVLKEITRLNEEDFSRIELRSLVAAAGDRVPVSTLIDWIKRDYFGAFASELVSTYSRSAGTDAAGELVKILKFHKLPSFQYEAAAALVKLGNVGPVEDKLGAETDPRQKERYRALLIR